MPLPLTDYTRIVPSAWVVSTLYRRRADCFI